MIKTLLKTPQYLSIIDCAGYLLHFVTLNVIQFQLERLLTDVVEPGNVGLNAALYRIRFKIIKQLCIEVGSSCVEIWSH